MVHAWERLAWEMRWPLVCSVTGTGRVRRLLSSYSVTGSKVAGQRFVLVLSRLNQKKSKADYGF